MAEPAAIPPLDEITGWPPPEAQSQWFGSPENEAMLARTYASGRMHHAWLIGGIKGVGKATMAFRLARFLLANPDPASVRMPATLAVPPESKVSRQVAAGAHPNLLVLRKPWDEATKRYRTELTVGEVRRIRKFFGSTSGEPGWRICIVDTADDLNISAANALLKMLEEPPENGLFLLVANRPGQLLPTIRSRCGRLDLKPLSTAAIAKAIGEQQGATVSAEIGLAAELAGGSLRRAILGIDGSQASIYRRFAELTHDLPAIDFAGVHELADKVSGRGLDEEFESFVALVGDWLSRRVRGLAEPTGALSPGTSGASVASWAAVWDKLRESSVQAEALNLDRKQVVLQVFTALANATRA